MDATQLAHSLGLATGRRELAERLLGELRRQVALWRAAEAKAGGPLGAVRSAFLWSLTERWCSRVEALAAQVESELAQLRTAELGARAQYEQAARAAQAAPPPAPEPPKPPTFMGAVQAVADRNWWRRRS